MQLDSSTRGSAISHNGTFAGMFNEETHGKTLARKPTRQEVRKHQTGQCACFLCLVSTASRQVLVLRAPLLPSL